MSSARAVCKCVVNFVSVWLTAERGAAGAGFQQRGLRLALGVPDSDGLLDDVTYELCPQRVGYRALHVGSLHGGGTQGCRPLLQYSRLP